MFFNIFYKIKNLNILNKNRVFFFNLLNFLLLQIMKILLFLTKKVYAFTSFIKVYKKFGSTDNKNLHLFNKKSVFFTFFIKFY